MSINILNGHSDNVITENLKSFLSKGFDWSNAVNLALQLAGRDISEFDDYLTEDLDNRLLFAVGTFNDIEITLETLNNIVSAFYELESIFTPNIKITHLEYEDHQKNPILYQYPFKFGEIRNLRIVDNKYLYGDMKKVPKRIARLVKSFALPRLSIEIFNNLSTPNLPPPYKKVYACVLDAVALLGAEREALFEVMQSYGLKDCAIKKVVINQSIENPEGFDFSGEKVIFEFSKEKKTKMDEAQVKTFTESIRESINNGFAQTIALFKKDTTKTETEPEKEVFSKEDVTKLIDSTVNKVSQNYQSKLESLKNLMKEQGEQFSKLQNKSSQETDSMRFEKLNRESKLPKAMNELMLGFCVDLDKVENHVKQFNLKFQLGEKELTIKEKFMQILETLPSLTAYSTQMFSGNQRHAEITHSDAQEFSHLENNESVDAQLDLQAFAKAQNLKFETTKDKRIASEKYYEATGIVV